MSKPKKLTTSTTTATKPAGVQGKPPITPHACAAPMLRKPFGFIFMMALVKFGGGVAGMSGKVGGTIFTRNTYGAIARNWSKPVFKATTAQLAVNAAFGAMSQLWRTLTASQRTGWDSLASTVSFVNRIGENIFLSGQAMFNKLNQNLLSAGQLSIDDAPAYVIPASLTSVGSNIQITGDRFDVAFNPSPVPADVIMQIWATPQLSPGITFVKNLYKLVANVNPAGLQPADIFAEYTALYGDLVLDQNVFVKVRYVDINTGVASPFIQTEGIVAA
jgi:hypothetical protein